VNYWPRSSALAMWQRFDAGEIREDFERMVAFDFDTVRFFVRWSDFEPHTGTIDAAMLDRFDTVLALADDMGLRALPSLVGGYMGGAVRDLYRGAVLDAQLRLVRMLAERASTHASLAAFDLAHEFSKLSLPAQVRVSAGEHSTEPAAAPLVADWSRRLSEAIRTASRAPITATVASEDLTRERFYRLASLAMPFGFISLNASNLTAAFGRSKLDPEVIPFLASLAAAFSYKPVLLTGFGNPTCPPEKFSAFDRFAAEDERPNATISPDDTAFATYPCCTEGENAAWCASVLERLQQDGRLGALWWCWSDFSADVLKGLPDALPDHERANGILRADGSEKPVASVLSRFARERRAVVRAADMPMIATTYYYRTLPTATKTLFDAFLGFVAERRARL